MADGPREALWHVLDPTDGPVLKACGNQRRLIDAGSAILAREAVGALHELPVQDVIETVHGGDPYAAPQTIVIAGWCTCQYQGRHHLLRRSRDRRCRTVTNAPEAAARFRSADRAVSILSGFG